MKNSCSHNHSYVWFWLIGFYICAFYIKLPHCQDRSFAIEDLRVSGSLKNHKLSGAIVDLDFYELKRRLE
jgi:hypothetical protein